MNRIDVAVVGAGPVGLSATIDLARRGISVMVFDKHAEPALHPKSRAVNVRTMEIFRSWGIEERVRAAGLATPPVRYLGKDAVSPWSEVVESSVVEDGGDNDLSPLPLEMFLCSQDILEPVLREAALQPPVDVRLSTEVLSVTETKDGVRLELRSRLDGSTETVEAAFVIGADGAQSGIREQLGIERDGEPSLQQSVSVLFRSDLIRSRTDSESAFIYIDNPDTVGTVVLAPVDAEGRVAMLGRPPVLDRLPIDQVDWQEQTRLAAGDPDLDVEIIDYRPWEVGAWVANDYQKGRIFLAGDAAHVMPPYGGFNQNAGIQDVHNLTWKLAAVLRGWATPALLETYGPERRPVALFDREEAVLNFRSHVGAEHDGPRAFRTENFHHLGLDIGYRYDQGAIVLEPGRPRGPWQVSTYTPSADPGERAPHVWLDEARTISTLDVLGPGVTVFAAVGSRAAGGAVRAATDHGVPATSVDLPPGALATYGIASDGAVLVRPDGHVLARVTNNDPVTVAKALAAITGAPVVQPA
ncbi:2,4-dichlorophenol 6-monooxygenase [Actinobacteria bacterium OK006]|nr:2,4-dichlorophenol 6-monooxygenase [Actinobacteria bacterium OK006]